MRSVSPEAGQSIDHARSSDTLSGEIALSARLGLPLALGELGWMSTYIVDALMVGRLPHSALAIAASSLGNTIFYAIAFCAIGLMTGIQSLVAQSYGRGDEADSTRTIAQSMWFVLLGTPVVMLATLASVPLLAHFGTPADIILETDRYLHALVWSTGPLLLYWALRRYLQSIDRVLLIVVSLLTGGIVNFVGDWAFLYGHLGLHPFGIAGSGWATCVVRVYAAALLLAAFSWRSGGRLTQLIARPDWGRIGVLFRIGWPAALESLADLGVSTFMSILCARLGATLLAAHQVVLDLDAFIYMVPLGISYAAAARVGQSAGRGSIEQVRRSSRASLLLAMGFTCVVAPLLAGFPHVWGGWYSNDASVVIAAAPLFVMCGVIQFGDASGIVLAGSFVGIGDTRTALVVNMIWSWLLGMPLSYWLTFHRGFGVEGLWFGRLVAAIGSAVTLWVAWRMRMGRGRIFSAASG